MPKRTLSMCQNILKKPSTDTRHVQSKQSDSLGETDNTQSSITKSKGYSLEIGNK